MIIYHKRYLVYKVVLPQLLIFQQNNSAQTSVLIFFTSRHYYFVEKLKIVEEQLCKLNTSYGKLSHTLKLPAHFTCGQEVLGTAANRNTAIRHLAAKNITSQSGLVSNITC